MAHESEPYVLGRHFPSSRQFLLPIPLATEKYEPATVLSLSATDDWMFAYFPGREGPGAGVVWQKEAQLDSWCVKECVEFPVGRGVVTAAWTCPQREVRLMLSYRAFVVSSDCSGLSPMRAPRLAYLYSDRSHRLEARSYCWSLNLTGFACIT